MIRASSASSRLAKSSSTLANISGEISSVIAPSEDIEVSLGPR